MRSINRLSFLVGAALMGAAAQSFRMAEDAPAAAPAPEPVTPAADVAVTVPAQHESIVQRFVDLLKSGEQWVVDNVEAGLAHFESLLSPAEESDPEPAAPADTEPKA